MNKVKAVFITAKDPWGEPSGGQSTFAKHLLNAYGDSLAFTSDCNEALPVGEWVERKYKNQVIKFLSRGSTHQKKDKKPFIPARVPTYFRARQYMAKIYSLGIRNVFTDSPEFLLALSGRHWESVCYRFAGVNNPVAFSRYPWLRFLGGSYEWLMLKTLQKVNPDVMIAAADQRAIDAFFERTRAKLDRSKFHQFPTRVDTELFCPMPRDSVRQELCFSQDRLILVATGRLCWIKGWDLLLEALNVLVKSRPDTQLIFVGDGEDHQAVIQRSKQLGVYKNILITGFLPQAEVVKYINAADVCTVASHREGWSLAMCEILACGQRIVSTDVSGARDMVHQGKNGFIVSGREPEDYANAILDSLELVGASEYSLKISSKYAVNQLVRDLGSIWSPLSGVHL
jgi:glycosyltransferase involved in cell wall biosynthesis